MMNKEELLALSGGTLGEGPPMFIPTGWDVAGPEIDDTYHGGIRDGQILLARVVLDSLKEGCLE